MHSKVYLSEIPESSTLMGKYAVEWESRKTGTPDYRLGVTNRLGTQLIRKESQV
ncbi:MAG: hypothetical protein ACI97A_003979 [Planctomycetota bacterium]|jgi:hypothetical protein